MWMERGRRRRQATRWNQPVNLSEVQLMSEEKQLNKYERDLMFILGICPDCIEQTFFGKDFKAGSFQNIACKNCGAEFSIMPPLYAERIGGACGTI